MDTSTNPDSKSQITVSNCKTSGTMKSATLTVTTPVGQLADYCCCGDINLALPSNKEKPLIHICGASLVRSLAEGKIKNCLQPNRATVPYVQEYVGPLLPEKKRFRTLKRSVKRHLEDRLVVKRGCCNLKSHEENILTTLNPSKNQDEDIFSFPMPSEDHQSPKETRHCTEGMTEREGPDGHRRRQPKITSRFPENYQLTFLNHLVSLYGCSRPRYCGPNTISKDNSFILNARNGLNLFKKETVNDELMRTANESYQQQFHKAPGAEREKHSKHNECADVEKNPARGHARQSTDLMHLEVAEPKDRGEYLCPVDTDAAGSITTSNSSVTQKAFNTFPYYANSTSSESFNFNTCWTPFDSNMPVHLIDNISHDSQWSGDKTLKTTNHKIDSAGCDLDTLSNANMRHADDQQSTTSGSQALPETTDKTTRSGYTLIDVSKGRHSYREKQLQEQKRNLKVATDGNQTVQDNPVSSCLTSDMPLPSIASATKTDLTVEPVKYNCARKIPSLMDLRISPLPITKFRSSSSDSIRPKPQYDISNASNPSRLKLPWDTYVTVKGSGICQIPCKEKPTSTLEQTKVRPTVPVDELNSPSLQVWSSTNLVTNQNDTIRSTEATNDKHEITTCREPDSQIITSTLASCSTHEGNQRSQANISGAKHAKGKHNLKTAGSNSAPSVRRDSLAHSLRTNPMELKRTDVSREFSLEVFVHNWSNTEPSAIYVNDRAGLNLLPPPQRVSHDSQDF